MFSETPDILSFDSTFRRDFLTSDEVERLRSGTLWILENVGVRFPSDVALELLSDHGAQIDWERQIVRMAPHLVEKAMSKAPPSFVLAGREPRFDLALDGEQIYLCADGTGVHVVDPEIRKVRSSTKSDVAMMARVSDALPLLGFYWPMVSAQDYGPTARLHEAHAGLTNTLKHVRGGSTMHPRLARYLVEMATAVAGSEQARRARPPLCANICSIAPLSNDQHGIESALVYAEAGIPTSFMAMPTMGSTAPATPYAAIVQGDAEVISAMVLIQLAFPGAPVFHSIIPSLLNPRTGGYISQAPSPSYLIAAQLARAWRVPCLGGARVSGDAPELGWQSGVEVGMGAMAIPHYGGEICGLLGLVASATTLFPEELVLDHEICLHVYQMLESFDFEQDAMALDLIKAVGPGSHFLNQKHTRDRIRDFQLPKLLGLKDRDGNRRDPRQVAQEEFRRLETTHHPEPLPDSVIQELGRIMGAADREAEKIYRQ